MIVLSKDRNWYRAALRLIGDGLPVEEIETKLGIKPSSLGIKGNLVRENPKYGKYPTNVWTLDSDTNSDVPFEEQITILLDLFEPKIEFIKEILALPGVKGELFLGSDIDSDSVFFSRELSERIAYFGLSIDLDLYPLDSK